MINLPERGTKEYDELIEKYVPHDCEQYKVIVKEADAVRRSLIDHKIKLDFAFKKRNGDMFWQTCVDETMDNILNKAEIVYQSYIRVSRERFAIKLMEFDELAKKHRAEKLEENSHQKLPPKATVSHRDELGFHC